MREIRILFIVNSHVEIDNHLPIIKCLNELRDNINIDILIANERFYVYTDSFNYENLKAFQIKTVGNFHKSKILKAILNNKLSVEQSSLSLKHKFFNGLFYYLKTHVLKHFNFAKADVAKDYNFVFATIGILEAIKKLGKITSLNRITFLRNDMQKIVLLPETYSQFKSKEQEFPFNSRENPIASQSFHAILICKAIESDISFSNKAQNIIEIGWPRYSKTWCEKIDVFYGGPENNSGPKKILFLPIKASPDGSWVREQIRKHINFAINYAKKERLDLLIKRHPRCNVPKSYWRKVMGNLKLSMRLDTIKCIIKSTVIYTPGTSLLGHVLWSDKVIILDDAWVDSAIQSFIYKEYCHTFDDKLKLVPPKKISLEEKVIFLQDEFQLGLDAVSFDAKLKNQLSKIITIH